MTQNKKKLQDQKFSPTNQRVNKEDNNNYRSGEAVAGENIKSVEKNLKTENSKDKSKIFNNIHTIPADEQQFENKSPDFKAAKNKP